MFRQYIRCGDCETYFDNLFNFLNEGFMLSEVICNSSGTPIDLKILEINKAFEEMFEIKKENILGKSIKEVHPVIEQSWIESWGKVALYGESIQSDIFFGKASKKFRVNVISPMKGQLVTLINDISVIMKADEALKKHLLLFENAQDIILYLKADGSIIDANKTAVEKYGYYYEELLKMRLQQLRHPSTMENFEKQMEASASTGIIFESIHVRKDGTSFPVEVSSKTIMINGELTRIHIIRDITERKQSEERIKYLASNDALTGISNRGFLIEQFEKALQQAQRSSQKLAVMLFDVDKFKMINDVYGHNAGDEVLKMVAQRLQDAVRKVDIIGRLGGDEFLIIQPFIKDKDDAIALANRILNYVAKPVKWDNSEINVLISIGIAIYPQDSADLKRLISCADTAMYSIKQKGGNAFNFYSA